MIYSLVEKILIGTRIQNIFNFSKSCFFKILIVQILICFPSFSSFLKAERFQGSISPKEKRIKDFKEELTENNPNLPKEYHLFFQQLAGDFAIFYDYDGRTIHFRYRRNKWDQDAIESVHNLLPGRSYLVEGEFLGIYYYPQVNESRNTVLPLFTKKEKTTIALMKDPNTIPIYKLLGYKETYSSSILFQTPDS
jgi:hypothetical protein